MCVEIKYNDAALRIDPSGHKNWVNPFSSRVPNLLPMGSRALWAEAVQNSLLWQRTVAWALSSHEVTTACSDPRPPGGTGPSLDAAGPSGVPEEQHLC